MQRDDRPRRRLYQRDPDLHGSARWASRAHLQARGFGADGYHLLAYGLPQSANDKRYAITSSSRRHRLTVAPTRSGKSVASTIPALLTYPGAVLAFDPKGELSLVSARYRLWIGIE